MSPFVSTVSYMEGVIDIFGMVRFDVGVLVLWDDLPEDDRSRCRYNPRRSTVEGRARYRDGPTLPARGGGGGGGGCTAAGPRVG